MLLRPVLLLLLVCALPGCVRVGFAPERSGDGGRDAALDHAEGGALDGSDALGDGAGDTLDAAADLQPDAPLPSGSHLWSRTLGAQSAVESTAVAVDGQGNTTVAGTFRGVLNVGGDDLASAGGLDIFLASFDASGAHRWSKRFGGGADDGVYDVVANASTGVLAFAGWYASGSISFGGATAGNAGGVDGFVASFSASGAHRWSRGFGSAGDDAAHGVGVDASGQVAVTGWFEDAIDLGGAPLTSAEGRDAFAASFDASGAHRWSKAFGGPGADAGYDAACSPLGTVAFVGDFEDTIDFSDGPRVSSGPADAFVAALDGAAGGLAWARSFGGASSDRGEGVVVDASGNVTATGYFSGTANLGGADLTGAGGVDVFVASFTAAGQHRWSDGFGGGADDVGQWLAVDADGNVTVTGEFSHTVDFGGGDLTCQGATNVFAVSFDAAGAHRWSRRFGGSGANSGLSVAAEPLSGALALTGYYQVSASFGGNTLTAVGGTDFFVARFDQAGQPGWARSFEGTGSGAALAVAAAQQSGDVIVAGPFYYTVDLGGGPLVSTGESDFFVASYDQAGQHRWSRRFGGAGYETPRAAAVDPQTGDVLLVGEFTQPFDVGGTSLSSAGGFEAFVVALDADGAVRWAKSFGGSGYDTAESVVFDAQAGQFVITGRYGDTIDFGGGALTPAGTGLYVAAFDRDGVHRWSQGHGGGDVASPAAIAVDPQSGELALTGEFRGTIDFGGGVLTSSPGTSDIFLARLHGDGAHRWSRRFGGAGFDSGGGVAIDHSGRVLVSGDFMLTADFGGGDLTAVGASDIFLASFEADGCHRWSRRFGSAASEYGSAVTVGPDNTVVLAGQLYDPVDLGGGALVSRGAADGFLASFEEDGTFRWSQSFGDTGNDGGGALATRGDRLLLSGWLTGVAHFGGAAVGAASGGFVASMVH